MPVIAIAVDPVTRIEGHLKAEIEVDTIGGVQQVSHVQMVGTLFRGFEKLLEGRDPRDAPIITSRICGVCPTSHAEVAVLALDQAAWALGGRLGLDVADNRTELDWAVKESRPIIWAPARMAADVAGLEAEPLTLAVWLAEKMRANRLDLALPPGAPMPAPETLIPLRRIGA